MSGAALSYHPILVEPTTWTRVVLSGRAVLPEGAQPDQHFERDGSVWRWRFERFDVPFEDMGEPTLVIWHELRAVGARCWVVDACEMHADTSSTGTMQIGQVALEVREGVPTIATAGGDLDIPDAERDFEAYFNGAKTLGPWLRRGQQLHAEIMEL